MLPLLSTELVSIRWSSEGFLLKENLVFAHSQQQQKLFGDKKVKIENGLQVVGI